MCEYFLHMILNELKQKIIIVESTIDNTICIVLRRQRTIMM
jgi:hypothetical protein